jgi:hypothetical protein
VVGHEKTLGFCVDCVVSGIDRKFSLCLLWFGA